ncbi:MAG: hypothetical protein K2I28_01275 [Muribaculaceae bacterium]|nr:hypothetical protein [Muribaculaceae bacterium]
MKKITLAISTLLLAASSAMAINAGSTYVVVPADAATKEAGMFLSVNGSGSLAYTNDLTDAAKWDYVIGEPEGYNYPFYLTNGGKYLNIAEEGAAMSDEPAKVFISFSNEVEGANTISNGNFSWYPQIPKPWYYLNAVNLATEPEATEASAFFFVEIDETTTIDDVNDALWSFEHPMTRVFAIGDNARRHLGKYLAATADGTVTTTNTFDDNAVWDIVWGEEGECIANLGVGGYLYERTDDGVKLSATKLPINMVDSKVLPGAFGLTTNMEATASDYDFINALNTGSGVTFWTLDAGSSFFMIEYDRSMTAEEIDAMVENKIAISSAIGEASKYMNSSVMGRKHGDTNLYAIENCGTAEEVEKAKVAAIKAAIDYAERTMKAGFVLKNTRTGQYINNVDNAEKPLVREASTGLNSLWYADFVADGATTQVGGYEFKTFVLRNAATGKYVGKCPGNSKVTPVADAEADAAQMMLVLGNSGFEIMQTNSGVADAYINVSTNDLAPELTIWTYANDGGAFFTFEEMPVMDSSSAWVDFEGEYTIDENMGSKLFTSISGVNIMLPADAELVGDGSVSLVRRVFDPNTYVMTKEPVYTWTNEMLKAAEPEVRTVERSYFDMNSFTYVTENVSALVFSLALPEAIVSPGDYGAETDPYLFQGTVDGASTLTGVLSSAITIEAVPMAVKVTPETGIVESITSIGIDTAADGESHGWVTADGMFGTLCVTFNEEYASDVNGNTIDLNGAQLNAYAAETGWEIPVNFTEPGLYALYIPAGFLTDSEGNISGETFVEWLIEEKDGILEVTSVKVNGNAVYDLQGRRVNKTGRGIYIIDGVKTFVK